MLLLKRFEKSSRLQELLAGASSLCMCSIDLNFLKLQHSGLATMELIDESNLIKDESGKILRDNVWGTLEQDCYRRDFTSKCSLLLPYYKKNRR